MERIIFRGKKNLNNAQGVVAEKEKLIIHVPSSPTLRPVSTLINYAKSKAPKISQPSLILLRELRSFMCDGRKSSAAVGGEMKRKMLKLPRSFKLIPIQVSEQ